MKSLFNRFARLAFQIAILIAFNWLGAQIGHILHSTVPGSLIGMFLLLAALCLKIIPLSSIETGGGWLLSEMMLLYIPSTIGVIQYPSLMLHDGMQLLAAITLSTLSIMVGIAVIARIISKIQGAPA